MADGIVVMRFTFPGTCALVLLVQACASQPVVRPSVAYSTAQLRDGAGVFVVPAERVTVTLEDILRLDDEMRAAVRQWVGDRRLSRTRMRSLVTGMVESGLLSLVYEQNTTRTARETFHSRAGNCLAFTNLFVAMGREAGLDVAFQVVDVPPFWYADSNTLVLANHVNTVVKMKRNDIAVVDFNAPEYQGDHDSREVSDAYAFALYYNNIGMEALSDGDIDTAFANLRAALDADATVAAVWVNLGVLYARMGANRQAESAYVHALSIEPRNRSALTNLVHTYRAAGNERLAERYAKRVQRYQDRNPYYHFINAEQALSAGDYPAALAFVDRAIRMKKTEHRFHFLKARVLGAMQDSSAALESLRMARKLVDIPSLAQRYDKKISSLNDATAD